MYKFKVLLTNPIHPKARAIIDALCEVTTCPDLSPETLRFCVADVDGLVVRTPLPGNILDSAPRLRVIVRHGVGLDFIPVDEATKRGIPVANVPGANTQAVVEHVLGLMLLLARKYHVLNSMTHAGQWSCRNQVSAFELTGKTLGIIGLGRIGGSLAAMCHKALGMRVLGYDPLARVWPEGCTPASMEEIFRQSDFVSLHVPLVPETRHMVGEKWLSMMKPQAYLINACRGQVLVEDDLVVELKTGGIAGAALDVFEEEPLPKEHPFLGLENLILTPHTAALTDESIERMGVESAHELLRALNGERPRNLVNPEVWQEYLDKYFSR